MNLPVIRADRYYYCGLDVARTGTDETIFTVLEVTEEGIGRVVYVEATRQMPTTDTCGRLIVLHNHFHFTRVFIDENSMGGGVVDRLKEQQLPIRGVPFTLKSKHEMFHNLKELMEHNRLFFAQELFNSEHWMRFSNQLTSLQYEYTSNGLAKFHHPDRGHDDYPDSLALSCMSLMKSKHGIQRMGIVDMSKIDKENLLGLQ